MHRGKTILVKWLKATQVSKIDKSQVDMEELFKGSCIQSRHLNCYLYNYAPYEKYLEGSVIWQKCSKYLYDYHRNLKIYIGNVLEENIAQH